MINLLAPLVTFAGAVGQFEWRRWSVRLANSGQLVGVLHLATYRAIAKRYPELEPDKLVGDLIASTPGEEGKWFATASALKLFDLALALARRSPTEPRTLIRAASAELAARPQFACDAGLLALHWIALDHGYEITGADVDDAVTVVRQAGIRIGRSAEVEAMIEAIAGRCQGRLGELMRRTHARQ